jgi:hypothetical protein
MTNSKKILAPVIFMICGVLLFWRVSSHTEDVAQQNAEKFYATLQVGAAFDRAAFEQRIKAMGRVRNFGDFEQAQAAVLHDEKENPYPLEVAVITAGREDLYYTWFIAPIPRWFRWTAWLTGNSDPLFNFRYATYAFSVKNGKIIEKLAFKKEGSPWIGWVVIDTIRPDEEGTRREKEARTQQESEEATRQRAEALYATLQIGAPFDRSDFERQIAAMGGKVEDFGNFGDFNVASGDLYAQRRDEAWQRGASRLDVAVVPQGGDVAYYTAFFTPYPGFINENRRKGESMLGTLSFYAFQVRDGIVVKKSVKKNGEWVDFN